MDRIDCARNGVLLVLFVRQKLQSLRRKRILSLGLCVRIAAIAQTSVITAELYVVAGNPSVTRQGGRPTNCCLLSRSLLTAKCESAKYVQL